MADTPNNSSTTATIAVGGSYTDQFEVADDHDWIRINLTAGQKITIRIAGSGANPVADPDVRLRDAAGTRLLTAAGTGADTLDFTVTATGTYYIDATGYQSAGQYTVTVTPYVAPTPADQWHLPLLGDLAAVWADYTGQGVHVGIYDEGVQYTHHDLDGNYDASRHVVVNGQTLDPTPATAESGHGTSVAGLIAAENDGVGTIGVAYHAGITGVNIFAGPADVNASDKSGFLQAVDQSEKFDVINHSWGRTPDFTNYSLDGQTASEWLEALVGGRGGLGTVEVNSAGNDNLNAEGSGYINTRATIVIGAYDDTGDASDYSNFGANLLVSAPSNGGTRGQVTTDLLGTSGYDGIDYTDSFGGTSGAAPLVTGVVALMMQANTNLGWRDVREILGLSATSVGSGVGGTKTADENDTWFYNKAANWNGGGLHFSRDYGFGAVNAYNAVRMAEAWGLFGSPATSANENRSTVSTASSKPLTDNGVTNVTFDFSGVPFAVESVDVSVNISHAALDSLVIELVSSSGAAVKLFDKDANSAGTNLTWSFNVNAFLGEKGQGTWTVRVTDTANGNTGTLNSASVTLNGSSQNLADNVYHFTDEYSNVVGKGNHAGVNDTNGGTDWIDAAALHAASTINLAAGTATIDGVNLTVAGVENVVAGDGADILTGDGNNNKLYGMRGADTLNGGGGNDTLNGGAGTDTMVGGLGNDTYYVDNSGDTITEAMGAGTGTDTVYATASFNLATRGANVETIIASAAGLTITGSSLANSLYDFASGAGTTLAGGQANDTYYVHNAASTISEDAAGGVDTVYAYASFNLATRGANVEAIIASAAGLTLTGNGLANSLYDYAAGAGTGMAGGTGNDAYYLRNGASTISEAAGAGTDTVYASVSTTLGANVENILATAAGLTITGNSLANTLYDWAASGSTMAGKAGNDIYTVRNTNSTVNEDATGGTDTVYAYASFNLNTRGANVETIIASAAGLTITGNGLNNGLYDFATGAGTGMAGGIGNDTYFVRNGASTIGEAAGAGADTVNAYVSFDLNTRGANVETIIAATAGLTIGGNNLANGLYDWAASGSTMKGAAGNDIYYVRNTNSTVNEDASGGTDTVYAYASFNLAARGANVETIIANAAGLTLTGNGGANGLYDYAAGGSALAGGGGNDAYYLRNGASTVSEDATGGADTIYAFVSTTLGANVENAVANATGLTIAGNSLANTLYDWAASGSTMAGKAGNDAYSVRNSNSLINETAEAGSGTDTAIAYADFNLGTRGANVENLRAGTGGNLVLTGNNLGNTIVGGAGSNTIAGGLGLDTLTGGAGADRFVFNTAASAANFDTLTDFSHAGDTISLSKTSFAALTGAAGAGIDPSQFNAVLSSAAYEANDRIIYQTDTGKLFYDADGFGSGTQAAVQIALLTTKPQDIAANDFLLIA